MCTVTFVPNSDRYLIAMNRDDAYSRASTNIPSALSCNGVIAVFPSEPNGGTWISANNAGLASALLNWNRPALTPKRRSRGEIIPSLAHSGNLDEVAKSLGEVPLDGVHPFRLICFSSRERKVREWRWDEKLSRVDHEWEYRHWFSSGLSDDEAFARRSEIVETALAEPDALSAPWVRRLHTFHEPGRGAFGICVHRQNGGTLSYTEVELSAIELTMHYRIGSACCDAPVLTTSVPLRQTPALLG